MTGVGGGERLDSWKAIATYLGKDAGTVRRWERTRGLPVHRVPGGKGTSVYAYAAEIDAWLKSPEQEEASAEGADDEGAPMASPSRLWRWLLVPAVAALVAVIWWAASPDTAPPDLRINLTEHSVVARDGDGRELWVHPLADGWRHLKSEVSAASQVMPGSQGRAYFITSHRQKGMDGAVEGGEFTALDAEGHAQFTFRFFDNLRFGGKPYGEPWAITAFSALDSDPPRLAVAAHHWLWPPSMLAVLDAKGNRLGTYANHGWIEQLQWLSSNRLLFGGFSHSKDGGLVGLLDPAQLDGQSPEDIGSPTHCETCGSNPPLKLVVMPRSEVNIHSRSRFNRAVLERTGDRLVARTIEVPAADGQGAADAIYEFTLSLDLVRASYSDYYWQVHDRLFEEKELDHDRAHCPYKNGPPSVMVWTRETGWAVAHTN